jgi:hypothetical protein
MSHAILVGSTNPILFFRAFDTDGTANVTFTSATAGASLSAYRTGGSSVAITPLSDKAADDTAHADGAIRQVSGNLYTVDGPDAAVAAQFGSVSIKGSYTAGVIEGVPHPLVGYNGATVAVGANTTTPLTDAGVRTAVGLATADLDTQLSDVPTVSEFNARTILAAAYFDPAVDVVANVTLVATTTTNSDMRGTDGANTVVPPAMRGTDGANTVVPPAASIFAGITILAEWLGLMAGKQVADATALAEIKTSGVGSGAYSELTDSLEAIRDAGSGDATAANQALMMGSSFATGTDSLEAIRDRGDDAWSSSIGGGAFEISLTIKLSDASLVPECDCVLTTSNGDPATDVYASVRSSSAAIALFTCDAGTYYLWRQKAGFNFTNPKTVTVSSVGVATIT